MCRKASGLLGGSQSSICLGDDTDALPSCASIAHFGENAQENDSALEQCQAVYQRPAPESPLWVGDIAESARRRIWRFGVWVPQSYYAWRGGNSHVRVHAWSGVQRFARTLEISGEIAFRPWGGYRPSFRVSASR